MILFLTVQVLWFAAIRTTAQQQQKTRSLARVTTPEEVWEHIKLRSIEELKEIMEKLEVEYDEGLLTDEDGFRTYVYDEEVMEVWLKKYPEEVMKLKPPSPPPSPPKNNKKPPEPPYTTTTTTGTSTEPESTDNLWAKANKMMKNIFLGKKDEEL